MADRKGSKDFATEKNTKAPEGATTGVGVGGAVGALLACWPASGRWQFRVLVRSLRRVRSWVRSLVSALVVQSAVWSEHSLASGFQSSKPSAMRSVRMAAYCCQCIAIRQKRSHARRKF